MAGSEVSVDSAAVPGEALPESVQRVTDAGSTDDGVGGRERVWVHRAAAAGLVLLAANILFRAARSRGYYCEDDYGHLLLSREAWRHPSLILDVWGRPLMTAVFMPAAKIGRDVGIRATALVLISVAALCCYGRRRALGSSVALLAPVSLLALPLMARLSFTALPYAPFACVLGLALWLEARGRQLAAAVVVSMLPLARLEGLVVIIVWAVWLAWQRRWLLVPVVGLGVVMWALIGAVTHSDLLWILHGSPYGVSGSAYGRVGWTYIFHAFPIFVGPVMGGLLFASLALRLKRDVLVCAIALALLGFYVVAWGLGDFNTLATPIYLTTMSVPFALITSEVLEVALQGRSVSMHPILVIVAALVGVALLAVGRRPSDVVMILVAGAFVLWLSPLIDLRDHVRALAGWCVLPVAVLAGIVLTHAIPLDGSPSVSRQIAKEPVAKRIAFWTDPAFGWYANRPPSPPVSILKDLSIGGYVLRDSSLGKYVVSDSRLRHLGYRPVRSQSANGTVVTLWRRVQTTPLNKLK